MRASTTPAAAVSRGPRKKPFGYDFVMGMSPSFVVASLLLMLFIFFWQNWELDRLVGAEAQLRVRRVLDGDQFLANTEDGYLVKVRLRAVDAPELEQPFGREASAALSEKLTAAHTDVIAFFYERDHEGRYIADIFTQHGVSAEFHYVQAHMVRRGLAWHFGAFDRRVRLKEMMENATAAKIGLWSDEAPVAPWRFRRQAEKEARVRADSSRKKKDADPRKRGHHNSKSRRG
ncbi:putative 38.1 kDa protein [Diplonema papillatum]|nr:putative 38.1 kDa protein [Diplonema papillatum]